MEIKRKQKPGSSKYPFTHFIDRTNLFLQSTLTSTNACFTKKPVFIFYCRHTICMRPSTYPSVTWEMLESFQVFVFNGVIYSKQNKKLTTKGLDICIMDAFGNVFSVSNTFKLQYQCFAPIPEIGFIGKWNVKRGKLVTLIPADRNEGMIQNILLQNFRERFYQSHISKSTAISMLPS